MWKEGLLMKLNKWGMTGPAYRWIKEFLYGQSVEVKVGSTILETWNASRKYSESLVIFYYDKLFFF